jgi:hypothetical protein
VLLQHLDESLSDDARSTKNSNWEFCGHSDVFRILQHDLPDHRLVTKANYSGSLEPDLEIVGEGWFATLWHSN